MPTAVTVLARKDFDHKGRTVRAGQEISLAPVEAAILARKGFVNLSKQTRDMTAGEGAAPRARTPRAPRAGRQYLRTDITAESSE